MCNHCSDLENKRHSLAHVMAWAVKKLYPEVKFAIGPTIENGFYYDFDDLAIGEADLIKIEDKMRELIKIGFEVTQRTAPCDEAIGQAEIQGQPYKAELIKDLAATGETEVSFYKIGGFEDLCRGPHIANSKELAVDSFKLIKLAGAYWRGNEKNKMLTRIYAVAFNNKAELDEYIRLIEEAEKRDHRKLGKEMDLFMMHEYAPGMPFFLPKGMIILRELMQYVREVSYGDGYKEVRTPQLLNSDLWKTSGHWGHYKDDMFCLHHAEDNIDMGIKPMNCPAHMLVFKNDIRSYRELPLRLAEMTTLYRNEKSGTLHGLTRVRSLSQDDSHIFVREEQILEEIKTLIAKIKHIYKTFNLEIDEVHLSTRPEEFLGEVEVWDRAEAALKTALTDGGLEYKINEGDGAFYGPKIDVKIKDAIGRQWQLATIQLDFQMPRRFELNYADSDGQLKTPVVIHRALLGSLERFFGIIIEHYAGAFPTWLSPVQVKLLAVGEKHRAFCFEFAEELKANNIRVEVDAADETLGNKIRKAAAEKIPYMLVVGDKEMESGEFAVRDRGQRESRNISKADLVKEILEKIKQRS